MIFFLELFHRHGIDANAPEDTFVDKRKMVKASHAAYKPNDAEKWQSRIFLVPEICQARQNRNATAHDQGIGEKDRNQWWQIPLQGSAQDGHTSGHITGGYSKQASFCLLLD